jgi:hypothetical protein
LRDPTKRQRLRARQDAGPQANGAKLRQIKEQLKATRHDGVEAQGKWFAQVLRGWLAYYAVPMSAPAITAFRHHVVERWLRAIRRRGQKHRLAWPRMKVIANWYLPHPCIQHPWPEQRFLVNHPDDVPKRQSGWGAAVWAFLCGGPQAALIVWMSGCTPRMAIIRFRL